MMKTLPVGVAWQAPSADPTECSTTNKGIVRWHCQNNCKGPTLDEEVERLCGTELAPLGKSGGTVQLEIFAAVEMALLIEMIVYG